MHRTVTSHPGVAHVVETHAGLPPRQSFECVAGDWGFSSCDTYEGTLPDGTTFELREWDYLWINEDGHITRWDWFVDSAAWAKLLSLVGLDPDGLTCQAYTINYLQESGAGS